MIDIELYSEEPHQPFGERLAALLQEPLFVDLAIAYVSASGADYIQSLIDHLHGQAPVRLLVNVLFPTDLDRVAKLAEQIEVWIHLGYDNEAEGLHGQFHSKILFVERSDGFRTVVIGSHNWTANGLYGGNLEASVVLTCDDSQPVVNQVCADIKACRESARCELFDPSRLNVYKRLQRKYHPRLRQRRSHSLQLPFRGFVPFQGLVILAEDHTGGALAHAGIVFIRIPATWSGGATTVTSAWLFMFDKDSLFGSQRNTPRPFRLEGSRETVSRNPARLRTATAEYVIADLERPCVVPLRGEAALELQEGDEWLVINFHRTDQRELLPVFSAGDGEPVWRIKDDLADDSVANFERECDSLAAAKHLLARSVVQVPFQFAYPPTLTTSLENYQLQERDRGQRISYQLDVKDMKREVSRYVCVVSFRSEAGLTEAVYGTTM